MYHSLTLPPPLTRTWQVMARDLELLQDFFLARDVHGVVHGVALHVIAEMTQTLQHLSVRETTLVLTPADMQT